LAGAVGANYAAARFDLKQQKKLPQPLPQSVHREPKLKFLLPSINCFSHFCLATRILHPFSLSGLGDLSILSHAYLHLRKGLLSIVKFTFNKATQSCYLTTTDQLLSADNQIHNPTTYQLRLLHPTQRPTAQPLAQISQTPRITISG
jgi:hypothetical protein